LCARSRTRKVFHECTQRPHPGGTGHRRLLRDREATARAFHALDFKVALLARRTESIEAIAHELGEGAVAVAADVTDRDALIAAAERVKAELGRVDVLVNNAGIMHLAINEILLRPATLA